MARRGETAALGAVAVAAASMVVSGLVHVHLWDIAYRHVATLGPLFVVQAVTALVGAALLVVTRAVVVALASAGLLAGTVVGFVLADTVGLFGFTLPVVTSWAWVALVSEVIGTVLSTALVVRSWRSRRADRPSADGSVAAPRV